MCPLELFDDVFRVLFFVLHVFAPFGTELQVLGVLGVESSNAAWLVNCENAGGRIFSGLGPSQLNFSGLQDVRNHS